MIIFDGGGFVLRGQHDQRADSPSNKGRPVAGVNSHGAHAENSKHINHGADYVENAPGCYSEHFTRDENPKHQGECGADAGEKRAG